MTQQFIADASFWQLFPQAQLAVLILDNINNQGESSPAIKQLLAEANLAAKKHLTAEQLSQNPAVAVWREAYQQFKTKKGVRSSIEALLKRVEQGKAHHPRRRRILRAWRRRKFAHAGRRTLLHRRRRRSLPLLQLARWQTHHDYRKQPPRVYRAGISQRRPPCRFGSCACRHRPPRPSRTGRKRCAPSYFDRR